MNPRFFLKMNSHFIEFGIYWESVNSRRCEMIANSTRFDKTSFLAMRRSLEKKQNVSAGIWLVAMIILCNAVSFIVNFSDSFLYVSFVSFTGLLIFFAILGTIARFRKFAESDRRLMEGYTVDSEFREEDFSLRFRGPSFESTETWRYSLLHCVYETKDFIYLMRNKSEMQVLAKDGFVSGTASELLDLLARNGVKIN